MPPADAIKAAMRHLTILGALDVPRRQELPTLIEKGSGVLRRDPTTINQLGKVLSKIPLSPKYAKMLIVASKYRVLQFTIMMVACMSVNELFNNTTQEQAKPNQQEDAQE